MAYRLFAFAVFCLFGTASVLGQSDTLLVKSFGGPNFERASEVIACNAGGYAIVGTTGSNETGNTDVFVARFDGDLNCMWSKNFGGDDVEWAHSMTEDWSGNFLVCGYSLSFGAGSYDMYIIKLDADGEVIWQQTFGGVDWDFGEKIIPHPQGGFLIAGSSYSAGNGGQDGTILHIDGQGVLINQWFVGGAENDGIHDVVAVNDGWIACGFQTVDNVMKSAVWRFDVTGSVVWSRLVDDTSGYDRDALALTMDADFLYLTGPVYADGVTRSFEQQLRLDNGVNYEVVEQESFDVQYFDCTYYNGELVFLGSKSLSGIELGRVTRKRNDTFFTGAFEFTGQYRTRFLSAIWDQEALVLCGGYQPDPSENWQALIVKYTSRNLNEVGVEPELVPCFAVGVEEEQPIADGVQGRILTIQGAVVEIDYTWNASNMPTSLAAGMYFFQPKKGSAVKKFTVH